MSPMYTVHCPMSIVNKITQYFFLKSKNTIVWILCVMYING